MIGLNEPVTHTQKLRKQKVGLNLEIAEIVVQLQGHLKSLNYVFLFSHLKLDYCNLLKEVRLPIEMKQNT